MTKHIATAAALAFSATAVQAAPETLVVDKAHSEVGFRVRHMLSKTAGRFTDFSGQVHFDPQNPESSSVEFHIRAASVDTDVAVRDAAWTAASA